MKEQESTELKETRQRGCLRYLIWLVLLILLVLLLIPLLLQWSLVQNWVADKAATKISEKTGTIVEVQEVDFSVFKGLILEKMLIVSEDQDTLAYIGAFSSSLEENIFSLINNKLVLNELSVDNVLINVVKEEGASLTNLETFIDKLSQKESNTKEKSKAGLDLSLKEIYFTNVFLTEEIVNTSKRSLNIAEGKLLIDKIDLKNKEFIISQLMLSRPRYLEEKNAGKAISAPQETRDSISQSILVSVHSLEVSQGELILDNWYKAPSEKTSAFDVNHLHLSEFNLIADSTIYMQPFSLRSQIKSLTLSEDNGFDINELNVSQLFVDDKKIELNSFLLNTGKSQLGEALTFKYSEFSDFKKFAQKIEILADLKQAKLAFSDMMYFFPDLKRSAFSKLNSTKWIELTGDISGTIDNLEADDLSLSFYDMVTLDGYLSTYDLTKAEDALINLHVDKFNTSLTNLSKIIPGFKIPEQFYKLDPIRFSGDIDGFFKDFVVYGTMDSPLGVVNLDTRLNIKKGIDYAEYSGEVAVENFNMNQWTGNDDFGFATFSAEILDGKGLTIDNILTDLTAELELFDFKGYSYRDVKLEGEFAQNLFNGQFVSADPNAEMNFEGEIFVKDGQITSDFKTAIEKIDLTALNLSKDISAINGDIDLRLEGSKSTDFIGEADIKNLSITYKGKQFDFDSLMVNSTPELNDSRNITVTSDVLNCTVDGDFNFADLVPVFKNHLVYAHPDWAAKFDIKRSPGVRKEQRFGFKLHVADSKDYLELANVPDLRLYNLSLKGNINTKEKKYQSTLFVDQVDYKDMQFSNMDLVFDQDDKKSDNSLAFSKIISGRSEFNPVEIFAQLEDNNLSVRFITKELLDSLEQIDLALNVYPEGDDIVASLSKNTLTMFSSEWDVNPDNKVTYGKNKIEIEKFVLTDGQRNILIDDINSRGLLAEIQNFNFLTINGLINYDKIKFAGDGDLNFSKADLFETSATTFDMEIEEFTLNDVDYGSLYVNAIDDGTDKLSALVFLNKPEESMNLDIGFDVDKKTKEINGTITASNLPMETFEFIIDDGISDTAGDADVMNGKISGTLDDIKLSAYGQVEGGTTTIDYLGAKLYLGNEKFLITESEINLSGATILDKYGNVAQVEGGLYHSLFTDFTTDLTMSSDYFLALDTEKDENPSYYGQGIGDMVVSFSGPFSSTDITVNAVTARGTVLNIPVGEVVTSNDESFIQIVSRDDILGNADTTIVFQAPKLEGVDIRMDLVVTEDAKFNIIFDETRNDIIKGTGNGNMRVVVSRQGDFNIFGEYVIEQGEYLFTYLGGIVSKPFTVKKGGQITWTGDPINANINLEATYEKLRTPTSVFLAEYLTSVNEAEARQRTDVDLSMFLTGTLYEPNVDFDIDFPELQGGLRALAESKMRVLRDNEADLNEQVAGLIMFGSFLPSSSLGNEVGSASGLARTGYNTLSEMVSNQLSYLLSGFLQEALTENGFVSGIDFEVGFSKNAEFDIDPSRPTPSNSGIIPDEIEVHLKPRFQNDKWDIDYGTSFVTNTTIPDYIIYDFVLGFFLTEDRRLKLKAYGKWDRDLGGQAGQKFGFGINYKKEFGSIIDFKKELSEKIGELKKEENN